LYSGMLRNQLKPPMRTKRQSLLSTGACLQHDKAHIIQHVLPWNRTGI